jgi:putative sporulation protein YyaC
MVTNNKLSIDSLFPSSYIELGEFLYKSLEEIISENREIVFVCIGTDRCTGDSLGPLVGYKLKSFYKEIPKSNIYIYGSLENPVHSKNVSNIIDKIKVNFNNPYIIAIDSCLGKINNIGKILVENRPLSPGLALNKDLPPIGDLSITGIVNISGSYEFIILQNTRLYTVMSLADCISQGIIHLINKIIDNSNSLALK